VKYTKTILCLANSRKMSGRCIAGKEVREEGYGAWIRPVSKRPTEEISEEDRRYENGEDPKLLDIIQIPFLKPCPSHLQSENHLINDGYYWKRVGRLGWKDLKPALDALDGRLWLNGNSSYNGLNDRVPVDQAQQLTTSLALIRPQNLKLIVAIEGAAYRKRRVRAQFQFKGDRYRLSVTDPLLSESI
jgi:hypothetical protein